MFVQLRNRKVAKMIMIKLGIAPLLFEDRQCDFNCERDINKGRPFLKCVYSIWALPEGGGGLKACQDGSEHFFPMFARG